MKKTQLQKSHATVPFISTSLAINLWPRDKISLNRRYSVTKYQATKFRISRLLQRISKFAHNFIIRSWKKAATFYTERSLSQVKVVPVFKITKSPFNQNKTVSPLSEVSNDKQHDRPQFFCQTDPLSCALGQKSAEKSPNNGITSLSPFCETHFGFIRSPPPTM